MRVYKLNKILVVFTFIVLISICLWVFLKGESTNREVPKKATFVKNTMEVELYYE